MRILKASFVCGAIAACLAAVLSATGAFDVPIKTFFGAVGAAPALSAGGLWGAWPQWIGAVTLGFGLAWTTLDIGPLSLKMVIAGVALAETAVLSWVLREFGIVWPPFTGLAAGSLATLFGLGYGRTAVGKRKRQIEQLFGSCLSARARCALLDSDQPLVFSGECREASIVVCEIFNQESLTQALSPGDYVALTNGFLNTGARVLMEAGGTLDECGGDRLRVLFGLPLADTNHAVRACGAAFVLSQRLKRFCREAAERWNTAPDYRIGINSGELIAAAYGSGFAGGFGVTGEPLEFCRRLCVANTFYGSRILLGPRAFALAMSAVEVRPIELIRRRDQRVPQEIYELLAPKDRLTLEEADRREVFWKGVVLFRERRWDEAAVHFEAILADADFEDGPSRFYLDRIAHAREGIQALDWDSVKL